MRLFVNDIEIDLAEGSRIARTKQVNDIGSLSNRQSNYTQRIKVPRTKNNINALDHLWLSGNTSRAPYKKNTARLINDSGEDEIFDGQAVVFSSTDKHYELSIYDGYVSFVKAIENFSLTDLDISELNHLKNLANVIATYNDDTLNYRYNVADYNGKMTYGAGILNIDYLIPSVRKKYLWDKIFDFFGFTYSGSVFETEDFINNWMTYPKPIGDGTQVTTAIHTWDWNGTVVYESPSGSLNFRRSDFFTHNPVLNNSHAYSNGVSADNSPAGTMVTVIEAGLYKFEFDGVIAYPEKNGETTDNPIYIRHGFFSGEADYTEVIVNDNFTYGDDLNFTFYVQLEAGESFMLGGARPNLANISGDSYTGSVDIDFSIVEGNAVDFEEALLDFNVKDFVDEILWEFSLTPFKDRHTNNIRFLTHEEWLQSVDNYDLSGGKFIENKKERYILSGYAQKNWLRHRYNDENADYNDGSLNILNENLKEQTTIIQSRIYTPEKNKSDAVGYETNTYKIWEKQVKDDGTVSYKDLEKRFYFMRSEFSQRTTTFGSETEGVTQSVTGYYIENHDRLSFSEIVHRYYRPLYSILNTSKLNTSDVYWNDIDIANLDFKKLVFIKELGSYYMLNKISNYSGKGVHNTELIEVDYRDVSSEVLEPQPNIFIISGETPEDILTLYSFNNYTPASATIYAKQIDGDPTTAWSYTGTQYSEAVTISGNQITQDLPDPLGASEGWYEVYIEDSDGLQSNKEYVYVQDGGISNPSIEVSFDIEGTNFAEHERAFNYRFNNFMPTSATVTIQKANFNTGQGVGPAPSEALTVLTMNTDLSQQVTIPESLGWVYVLVTTNTISYTNTFLLF